MKLTANPPFLLILALLISPVIMLQGCGKNESVSDKSTITINPSAVTMKNPPSDTVVDFQVVVKYSDGTPTPYANIYISGAFAVPVTGALYQFYYYPNGTQNPNGNAAVNSGFNAQTDKYGVYDFSVVITGSAFKDTVYVTSGTAAVTATMEVTTGT